MRPLFPPLKELKSDQLHFSKTMAVWTEDFDVALDVTERGNNPVSITGRFVPTAYRAFGVWDFAPIEEVRFEFRSFAMVLA
jgi:hypothetical protein